MGVVSQDLLDLWDMQVAADKKGSDKRTVIRLDCCGSSVELQRLEDQYITCPNIDCRKQHFVTWSLRPKIQTRLDEPQL